MQLLLEELLAWVAILTINKTIVNKLISIEGLFKIIPLFLFNFYAIQPALRIIASNKNITKKVQVNLFKEASALLALLNIELPLAAIPPIPSPLGLWSKTRKIRRTPEITHIQLKTWIIAYKACINFKRVVRLYYNPLIQFL